MEALVSSTLAACSEAPWLSAWEVALICWEAATRLVAVSTTLPMVSLSFSVVAL
jgi:hypothetical protein